MTTVRNIRELINGYNDDTELLLYVDVENDLYMADLQVLTSGIVDNGPTTKPKLFLSITVSDSAKNAIQNGY